MGAVFPLAPQSRSNMKVAIAICIVFVVINSVYSEDSSNKDSALSRDTRHASPAKGKDRKVKRKGKKKQRKLKKKNEGKSKRNKNSKNKAKKKRNSKNGLRKNKSKNKKQRKNKTKRKNKEKRRMKNKSSNKKSKTKKRNGKLRKQKKNRKQTERSSNNTCTDKDKDKARNFIKQAKQIKTWYKLLTNKGEKGDVFSNYSKTLEEMTNNGTTCGATAKNALKFLRDCPATAKASCNTSEFTANETIAKDCENSVSCSNFPQECKDTIKVTHTGLKNLRQERCLNSSFPGSFSNCMKFVKELGNAIIKDCVAEIKASSGTTTTTQAPTITPSPNIVETKTIFTEGDEVVEQEESYNPDTKELTLTVPAHGDNVALTAIIGVDQMVTSYDNYCVLGDPPTDHTTEVYESSSSSDDANEVDPDSVDKVYTFNVVEGELTDAERAELPESFKTACKGKPIQKTKRIVVDEATFNKDSLDSVDDSRIMSRQGDCSSQKVTEDDDQ